jgi:hypothetical protein
VRHITRFVARRHHRLDFALGGIVLSNPGVLGKNRRGRIGRRNDAFDPGEKTS